jgi:hypothetical protein
MYIYVSRPHEVVDSLIYVSLLSLGQHSFPTLVASLLSRNYVKFRRADKFEEACKILWWQQIRLLVNNGM